MLSILRPIRITLLQISYIEYADSVNLMLLCFKLMLFKGYSCVKHKEVYIDSELGLATLNGSEILIQMKEECRKWQ